MAPKFPYRRVADDLRARLAAGEWAPGAQLPTRAKLAEEYGVNHMTIDRVIRELRADGLVETVPGLGMFVPEA